MRTFHALTAFSALAVWLASGCYRPSPRSAGSECGSDGECPASLQCICGMCVSDPEAAACSFSITVRAPACKRAEDAGSLCVKEEEFFPVTVVAHRDSEQKHSSRYAGTARFASTWGSPHALPFTFKDGVATAEVAIDRATPAHKAFLSVRAGSAVGASGTGIYVDPPDYQVEIAPVIAPPFGWAAGQVALPALDRVGDDRVMYFVGVEGKGSYPKIGVARSRDGEKWTPDPTPLFTPPPDVAYFSPSVMRTSEKNVELFFSAEAEGPAARANLLFASSSDGGHTFGAPMPILHGTSCAECTRGIMMPWVLVDPIDDLAWILYFSTAYELNRPPQLGVGRSVDRGATWNLDRVATPSTLVKKPAEAETAFSARVLHDPYTGIYRMWYVELDPMNPARCAFVIHYATSADGQFWTGQRSHVPGLKASDVQWTQSMGLQAVGLLPGAVEPPDWASQSPRYTLWISAVSDDGDLGCRPRMIGRAFRP